MVKPLDRVSSVPSGGALPRPNDEVDDRDVQYITDRGSPVTWEQADRCTRVGPGGEPDYDCDLCDGRGYLYSDPQTIPMLAQSMDLPRRLLPGGEFFPGTMTASCRPTDLIGFMDRFTFQKEYISVVELIKRRSSQDWDRIRYPSFLRLLRVRNNDTVFEEDTHFTLDGDKLTWIVAGPEAGSFYSARYIAHPVYLAIDPPQPRADARDRRSRRQAWRAILRRLDVFDQRWR